MKIALIVPALANKGPVIVARDLIHVLVTHGHECMVYYFDNIVELDFDCPLKRISFRESINFNTFDIVHSHGLRPDLYVWYHKPRSCKAKCLTTIHCFVIENLKSAYNWWIAHTIGPIWMRALQRMNRIVVLSNIAHKYYGRWFPLESIRVAYNTRIVDSTATLSATEEKNLLHFKNGSTLLGINALLSPIKGIDQVIKAMAFLPNCKLWINGDGKSMSELQALASDIGVIENVHFAGYQANAFRYLPYFDLYLMPSHSEGFPLALLEAAAYKKNIICSDIPIFREFFNDDEVSFFELGNLESLVDNINRAHKQNKSEAAYGRYMSEYDSESFYKNYISIYKELLNE